jgi:recombinational DNA repair protein (RecF pathway)
MIEIVTRAFILDKEPHRELDSRVTLYTEALGLIEGNATSTRKSTSKLGSHLEPLGYSTVRILKKNNFQIADALSHGSLPRTRKLVHLLQCLKAYISFEEPDQLLWEFFVALHAKQDISLKTLLTNWGFNPEEATCHLCSRTKPRYFSAHAFFICRRCAGTNSVTLVDYLTPFHLP